MLILALVFLLTPVFSQEIEPFSEDTKDTEKPEVFVKEKTEEEKSESRKEFENALEESKDTQIVGSRYKRKSPVSAMLLSGAIPGAGQFYVDRTSFSSYIYFLVDAALIYLMHDFNKKGDDIEEDYKKYAELHYSSVKQYKVQQILMDVIPSTATKEDHYNQAMFGLDTIEEWDLNTVIYNHENMQYRTQHFYEDIGKYNRYMFGWDDWFDLCVANAAQVIANPGSTTPIVEWIWQSDEDVPEDDPDHLWIGNTDYSTNEVNYQYTSNRAVYIQMRKDAEDEHSKATTCSFLLFGNHIVSAIHARHSARSYNSEHLTTSTKPQFHMTSRMFNNSVTPMLMLSKRF